MDYQDRVREEFQSLNEKLVKLQSFIDRPSFQDLHQVDCELLLAQRNHMQHYANVLDLRIARFPKVSAS